MAMVREEREDIRDSTEPWQLTPNTPLLLWSDGISLSLHIKALILELFKHQLAKPASLNTLPFL